MHSNIRFVLNFIKFCYISPIARTYAMVCLTIQYFCKLYIAVVHFELHSVDDTALTRSHVETGRRTIDSEIKQRDLIFLASFFDDVELYLGVLELPPHEQADVRTIVSKHGTQVGVANLLSLWRRRDPSAATFRVLLDIVRSLKKEQIADRILSYLGVTEYCK